MAWRPRRLSKEQKEERRRRAKELWATVEKSQRAIADELGVSKGAVSQWTKRLREEGEAGLKAKVHPGRRRGTSESQEQQLLADLSRGAKAWGFPIERWTCKRAAEVLKRSQGIAYHPDNLRKIVRRLSWSPQKAERRALQRNEVHIESWLQEAYPKLVKRGLSKELR